MRTFSKMFLVIAMIASTLGLTSAAAEAATTRSLTASFSTKTPTAGATVTVKGKLTKSPRKTKVSIQRKVGGTWRTVKTTRTTTSSGAYSTKFSMPSTAGNHLFRAAAARTSKLKAATSRTSTLDVRAKVAVSISVPASVYAGGTLTISGSLAPFRAGTKVAVQYSSSGTWKTLATATVSGTGSYAYAYAPTTKRKYRVSFAGAKGLAAAVSTSREVAVTALPATPLITTAATLPPAVVGTPYAVQLTTAGDEDGSWRVTSGALPGGLALDLATGLLSGTPTTDGSYSITVQFKRANGATEGFKTFSLTATSATPQAPVISTTGLPAGIVGAAFPTTTLRTLGDQPGAWTSTPLPPGLVLAAGTGVVSGVPTTAGPTTVTFTFTHANGLTDAQDISIQIDPVPPVTPAAIDPIVATGNNHTCRISATHVLSCWGDNIKAQVGNGPHGGQPTDQFSPATIGTASDWTSVSAGFWNTCATRADYSLWCWGHSSSGVLGRGTQIGDTDVPLQVTGSQHWKSVELGDFHACGITTGTALYCWGSGAAVGVPGADSSVPVQVGTETGWTSISAGGSHTCGVRDAKLYCWGMNRLGQLGDGGNTDLQLPTRIGTDADWTSVSAGAAHTCGLRTGDNLYCWGSNTAGQRGVGPVVPDVDDYPGSAPQLVGTGWASVSAGARTCALTTGGSLVCWGGTDIGYGTTVTRTTPGSAVTADVWTQVAVGGTHICAVRSDDTTWCWGQNYDGQLGIGGGAVIGNVTRELPTQTVS